MRVGCVVNKLKVLALVVSVAALSASCKGGGSGASSAPALNPSDSLHLVGYMLGRGFGRSIVNMRESGAKFDDTVLLMALREALSGLPSQLSDSMLRVVDRKLTREMEAKREEKYRKFEEESLAASKAFLEENKGKKGVKVTPSGLQYLVLAPGAGPKPGLDDKVRVNYRGSLSDGAVFDSSAAPALFVVKGMIPGWSEALQMMPVGSKYKFVVPPELAYGKEGAPSPLPIGPNAVMVLEVEMLGIEKQ